MKARWPHPLLLRPTGRGQDLGLAGGLSRVRCGCASQRPVITAPACLRACAGVLALALGVGGSTAWAQGAGEAQAAQGAQTGEETSSAPMPPTVRQLLDWALATRDAGGRQMVVVDKPQARIFVFDPQGRLLGAAPVLLGSALGDDSVPGIGERPLAKIRPHERTTPAGRFIAEPGRNAQGEDIVWVDYASAVSMHRVRTRVASERRLQRLASPVVADHRISYGCINLPVRFYERVLRPAVRHGAGAVVYVLPETRSPALVFGWSRTPDVPRAAADPGERLTAGAAPL